MCISNKKSLIVLMIMFGLLFTSFSYASSPTIEELQARVKDLQQQIEKIKVLIQNRITANSILYTQTLPACKSCSDGTECDKANNLEQTCRCYYDVTADGTISSSRTGYYRKCALTPAGYCDKCSDRTACGQLNASGQICACEKTATAGVYTSCQLSKYCKGCAENGALIGCNQLGSLNQLCRCTGPWASSNAAYGYYQTCQLGSTDNCKVCSDGTACGQLNASGQICACEKTATAGVYTSCQLSKYCKGCRIGDALINCDQSNDLGQYCKCSSPWTSNNTAYGYTQYCLLSDSNNCKVCSDGTACGQLNASGQICACEKTATAGVYTSCQLSKQCKSCSDNGASVGCDQSNDLGQHCKCYSSWTSNNAAYGYSQYCQLGSTDNCKVCSDGTACGQLNASGQICACEKTATAGVYTSCQLSKYCKNCSDSGGVLIGCNQSNSSLSQICRCGGSWTSNNAAYGYYQTCQLGSTDNCKVCSDGTACGQLNASGQICACAKTSTTGVYTQCQLAKQCKACSDSTACGQLNNLNQSCNCSGAWTENNAAYGYSQYCQLASTDNCRACSDGTACGQLNASGQICACTRTSTTGIYTGCALAKQCKGCSENGTFISCNQLGSLNQRCYCAGAWTDNNAAYGYYQTCQLDETDNCRACSDGTACGQLNASGQICACAKTSTTGVYTQCQLAKQCKACSDSTACGQLNNLNQSCNCSGAWTENNAAYGYSQYCQLASTDNCRACSDGTACGQLNASGQICACAKTDFAGVYRECQLSKQCKGCADSAGTALVTCGKTGSLNQLCNCTGSWTENNAAYGYSQYCQLASTDNCRACSDGTACGQLNASGQICACTRTSTTGIYTGCALAKQCKGCSEGIGTTLIACGKTGSLNQLCNCTGSWTENNAAYGYSQYCQLASTDNCRACSDGTACGQLNASGQICACTRTSTSGVYTYCSLAKQCKGCAENGQLVACGQTGSLNQTCRCSGGWVENNSAYGYYQYCQLDQTDNCKACSDGTACGQLNASGQICACVKTSASGVYTGCSLSKQCKACTDGTACTQSNSLDQNCICTGGWDNNNAALGYYQVCALSASGNCRTCSDGTACGSINREDKICACEMTSASGIYTGCRLATRCYGCSTAGSFVRCGGENSMGQICECTASWTTNNTAAYYKEKCTFITN